MSSSTVTKPPDLVQLVITVTDPLQFTLKVALSEVRSVDYALNMLAQAERMLMAERRKGDAAEMMAEMEEARKAEYDVEQARRLIVKPS